MDTSLLEYTAEDLIAHKLQRSGLLVAKPRFDQQGADLLAMLQVGDGARFCRVQCKGRTLRAPASRTEVVVPAAYVTPGLVLFLFVETGDAETTHLYCFFAADIRANWKTRGTALVLAVIAKSFTSELAAFEATSARVKLVAEAITASNVAEEMPLVAPIGMVTERDEAMPIGPGRGRTIGTVVEHSEAMPLRHEPDTAAGQADTSLHSSGPPTAGR